MISITKKFSRADAKQIILNRLIWPNWRGQWILGRHACLGLDVIKLASINTPIFNIQKGRVDFWLSCVKNPNLSTRTTEMLRFMNRKDIIPLLRQQESFNNLPKHPPSFVYMDSLSELVDQLFIHKVNRWGGCCYYSDINQTADFKRKFEEIGLIDMDEIESCYRDYFNLLRTKYDDVPIIFLHFPSALEKREKFLGRGQVILSVIEKIAKEHKNFFSLSIDETLVSKNIDAPPEMSDFPYHYNKETYNIFSKMLIEVLLSNNLLTK